MQNFYIVLAVLAVFTVPFYFTPVVEKIAMFTFNTMQKGMDAYRNAVIGVMFVVMLFYGVCMYFSWQATAIGLILSFAVEFIPARIRQVRNVSLAALQQFQVRQSIVKVGDFQ